MNAGLGQRAATLRQVQPVTKASVFRRRQGVVSWLMNVPACTCINKATRERPHTVRSATYPRWSRRRRWGWGWGCLDSERSPRRRRSWPQWPCPPRPPCTDSAAPCCVWLACFYAQQRVDFKERQKKSLKTKHQVQPKRYRLLILLWTSHTYVSVIAYWRMHS